MRGQSCPRSWESRLHNGLAENGLQPLRRHAARIGEIDLMMRAAELQAFGFGVTLHQCDGFALLIVGSNVQHLNALAFVNRFKFHFLDST